MKSFETFLNENKKESEMSPREIKMKFLNDLMDKGYIKPTANEDSFMEFVNNLLDDAEKNC